jgi:hypothetical protein
MNSPFESGSLGPSVSQRDSALESLEAIRDVLDRSTRYTQISSVGIALGGAAAMAAGTVGSILSMRKPLEFLSLWAVAFAIAIVLGVTTTSRKARRSGEPLWNRKLQFVLVRFAPCLVVGAVLTTAMAHMGRIEMAPGIWLGLYGLGILSVSMVLDWEFQLTGWSFLVASTVALFLLREHPNLSLLLGFGLIHVALGVFRVVKERRFSRGWAGSLSRDRRGREQRA